MVKLREDDNEVLAGWTSRVPHKRGHIFMSDLDKIPLKTVRKIVKEMQEVFKNWIGDIVIVQSSKGSYHLLSFYLNSFRKNVLMLIWLLERKILDINYLRFCFLRKHRVLRISAKTNKRNPKLIEVIGSQYCKRKECIRQRQIYLSTLEWGKNQKNISIVNMKPNGVKK